MLRANDSRQTAVPAEPLIPDENHLAHIGGWCHYARTVLWYRSSL